LQAAIISVWGAIVNEDIQEAGLSSFTSAFPRGLIDARVYTHDAEALRLAVTRDPKKEIALDAVKQWPTQELKPQRNTTNLQLQQSQNQSTGMRI
jgi:hypothetical protein